MGQTENKKIGTTALIEVMKGRDRSFEVLDEWIEIKGYDITESFFFYDNILFTERIRFEDCTFHEHFSLEKSIFENYVEFKNCKVLQSLFILAGTFHKTLRITQLDCKYFHLDSGNFQAIDFSSGNKEMSIWIRDAEFSEFNMGTYLGVDETKELIIYNQGKTKGKINIKGQTIAKLYMHGPNKDCQYLFEDVKTDYFHLSSFVNDGNLNIFGLSPATTGNSYFEISKSNLGKAQFHRVAFDEFTEVIIIDSYLSETNLINCHWKRDNIKPMVGPTYGNHDKNRKVRTKVHFNQLKEVFRQLKYVYEKQGDRIQEQFFYGLEMKVYNKKLNWTWPVFETFWEKLILYLSEHLTSFGSSFLRPLTGLILTNILILSVMINYYQYGGLSIVPYSLSDKAVVEQAFGLFFILLNPLHKVNDALRGWEIMWDLISRVMSSYFIYALIKSSRRFLR
ncbi:hypothetical protein SRABI27_03766 [Pedobacter sp. Bi27]|uniref:hypothetical protein n=1 Tax=Pedobacter sp. Bi27 TaxID=2822351 RepID=UPI001DBF3D09|nr:hypothetical protein [Pedobacter sp. Bi27]CAH0280701.1 hypothetical protein SRABI27_03766 [Pedobacter sp. Bi27]